MNTSLSGSTHADTLLDTSSRGNSGSSSSHGKSTSLPSGRYFSLLAGAVVCMAYSLLVTAREGPLSLCELDELLGRSLTILSTTDGAQQEGRVGEASFFQAHVYPASILMVPQTVNATTSSSPMKNLNINDRFIFAMDPTSFVDGLSDCIQDPNCHVLYHHVQKTGGTFLASTLYPLLNNNSYVDSFWCCHENYMKKFRRKPERYCRLPLGVYEVWGDEFAEVVETCQAYYDNINNNNNNDSNNVQRAIVLQTVRDPVTRTVSWIHQQCNKNYERMEEYQAVCDRCDYYQDQVVWDEFIDKQIHIYNLLSYELSHSSPSTVPIYTMEDVMMDPMLSMLEQRLRVQFPPGRPNTESKTHCDFHVPTAVFRKFDEARRVYRQLLTNVQLTPGGRRGQVAQTMA